MLHVFQGLISWTPLGLPAFLFVITLVVFFHELGHFLVARACGVKVDIFSIGFGPEIVGFNDRSGTRWRLSWIPVGGYVKFAGDANAASLPDASAAKTMSADERKVVLFFKPLWQRAAVAAAGPLANFIVAILVLTGLLMVSGRVTLSPVVGSVVKGSPAAEAGIAPGDRITSIDGIVVDDYFQLPQIISMRGGENLAIDLNRNGKALTVHAVPKLARVEDMLGETENTYVIGVGQARGLKFSRQPYSFGGAFVAATQETGNIIQSTLLGVVKLVQGHASPDQIRGTVGIMDVTQKVAQEGFLALLNLAAVLSVSIGLVNLFPIPVLDGGHLLYYACEAVLGRPLGERAQELGFRFGLLLIVGLVLFSTFHDLSRLNLF
jgi:regulator of sigma E protease